MGSYQSVLKPISKNNSPASLKIDNSKIKQKSYTCSYFFSSIYCLARGEDILNDDTSQSAAIILTDLRSLKSSNLFKLL